MELSIKVPGSTINPTASESKCKQMASATKAHTRMETNTAKESSIEATEVFTKENLKIISLKEKECLFGPISVYIRAISLKA
jgi:hypothetical protein